MVQESELHAALDRMGRQWHRLEICRAILRAALGSTAMLAAALLASWILPGEGAGEAALWAISGTAATLIALVFLLPLRRRAPRAQIARLIEDRCPELEDRVAAATETAARERTSPFAALLVADAAARIGAMPDGRIVDPRAQRRAGMAACGAVAMLVLVAGVAAPRIARTARVFEAMMFPATLTIDVLPGDIRIVSGRPLTIVARVRGGEHLPNRPRPELTVGVNESTRALPMVGTGAAGGEFHHTIAAVTGDFTYRVSAGAQASRDFTVTVVTGPRVDRIDVHYTYPSFTGLPPRTETDGGDIYAPVGTRVRIEVRADKPIAEGRLVMTDAAPLPLTIRPDGVLAADLRLEKDEAYRVALTDKDGLHTPGDTEYFIRTMTDRPPEVRVMRPSGDRQASPLEEVPIEARADDDYGLQALELVYAVGAGPERVVPLGQPGGATSLEGRTMIFLEDLKLQPGDFVSYYARARDVPRGKRASETRSDIYFVEIKPYGGEFQVAQSQAVSGGRGMSTLAAAQKEIVIATWKLERRAAAGRSAQDIKDVAKAQEELLLRASQGAQGASGRSRRLGQAGPETGGSPLAKAIEAMTRAAAALGSLKTADALPHEMEAYTQLLKAEAQQQRFQIARNQAGGGGGSNRSAPDLSALFDRELQRLQETNYETRSSLEERQDSTESEALARVRELARRQEDLNRQQRDLAKQTLDADELKRRLERLTREQAELRQRAEELAQQLDRQQSRQAQAAGGRDPKGAKPASEGQRGAPNSLRDASEAMSAAASDLRRQNPGGASASGDRAAEQLRQLERQLQAAQPADEKKALGNLQLEAQQIAETQRRLAAESERLDRGPPGPTGPASPGNDDARRRLAGEKQRLADRVDALERALTALGARSGTEAKARLGEAARTLDKEQAAERLRASAEALRRDAPGGQRDSKPEGPEGNVGNVGNVGDVGERAADQAVTRTLDRVARQLGATGDTADTRKLSEQLARTQQAQERLTALERQMDALRRKAEDAVAPKTPQGDQQASGKGNEQKSAAGQRGEDGQRGQGGDAGGELARLQREYLRELKQAEDVARQLQRQASGMGGTPEQHQFSLSAPGTEAFKQDYARWDTLRRDVHLAIETLQASLSAKLNEQRARDRVNAGGDDRVPEEYRASIAKYYQSIAANGKKP